MRIPTWIYRELEDQIAAVLSNCVRMAELGKVHAQIIVCSMVQSSFLATKLVSICDANKEAHYAELVFKQVVEPNAFLYNAMVRAYTHGGAHTKAVVLYKQMLRNWDPRSKLSTSPDKFTYPFVLKACAVLLALDIGRQIHAQLLRSGWGSVTVIENSLLEMYTKCNSLGDAHVLFDEMQQRDVVSWNTVVAAHARLGQMRKARAVFDAMPEKTVVTWTVLISGYTAIGCYADALEVFHRMQLAGLNPDDVAIVSVLPACTQLGALEVGRWIHRFSDKNGLLVKTHVCNALIEMYAKCGCIDQARLVFDNVQNKDVISWSTMINGLAHHGLARKAIELFVEMENQGMVTPNSITFLALLSACAHAGFLPDGLRFFNQMVKVYGLAPSVEHYGCMVDLLGRSGCIEQALELIRSMPVRPDAAIWGSLLSACKTCGNIDVAIIATEHLIELEPEDTGNYIILSNIYAAAGRWDAVSDMRKMIRTKNMKKTPGCSSIEVDNVVKEFVAGDDSKPEFSEISGLLELLAMELVDIKAASTHEKVDNVGSLW